MKPSVALPFLTGLAEQPPREVVGEPLGPPSLGAVTVHTTPIAVPDSETIGEPDIRENALGRVGDPQWPTDVTNGARDPPAIAR